MERGLSGVRAATSRRHGIPPDAELHGHELMGGSGEWKALRGKHREAAGVYAASLKVARAAGVAYIFRGLDLNRLNARYSYPGQPHGIVFGHLLERIDQFAERTNQDEPVIVVADEIATQDVHKRQFESYQSVGTPGYRSSQLSRISAPSGWWVR
ncbi:hypothetical protein [Herbiconiux liangxiaofengii]|uniref:hypothetical protein n=1 Tax=Herbiconiux liangxiaofengii TaxID=3342795 RepID=UPI0035BB8DC1